jgi:transposase
MAIRDMKLCFDCLRFRRERDEARREVKRLKEENRRLREKLDCAHRTILEAPFGSSTPSSKQPVKAKTTAERQARKGGARTGHKGRGRQTTSRRPTLPTETVAVPQACPNCGGRLELPSIRTRTLLSCQPPQPVTRSVDVQEAWCPDCHKTIRPRTPGAFPRMFLDNSALAYVAVEHYLHGQTLGRLAQITGVHKGTLTNAMHFLADLLAPGLEGVQQRLRLAAVIFADETVWRNDGDNGYAWMFRTGDCVLYRFCDTRSGEVPRSILGTDFLRGVLVTDRYAGYNGILMARQFCYAHLLRDLQDIERQFPDVPEVAAFVAHLAPLLSDAMALRREARNRAQYRCRARRLKARIQRAIRRPARHPAVQSYQDIFRQHRDKLYHWVDDPDVPPDNNTAERGLRPTVIARKLSFGSQSKRGASTREILMSIIGTISLRTHDPWRTLRDALDRLAASSSPPEDIGSILFPSVPSANAA